MKLFISALGQARQLKFSTYIHYEPNRSIPSHLSDLVQCRRGLNIFQHGCYISALEHARVLILSSYILLASINTVCNNVTLL